MCPISDKKIGERTSKGFTKFLVAFLGFILLLTFVTQRVDAASMYLNPGTGEYVAGSILRIDVLISSNDSINAVSGEIDFDTDFLKISFVSLDDTIIDFWVQEPTETEKGKIYYEGLILNPVFRGTGGRVLTIVFDILESSFGKTNVDISSVLLLANDGYGTNIVDEVSGATITVLNSGLNDVPEDVDVRSVSGSKIDIRTVGSADDFDPSITFQTPVVVGYTYSVDKEEDIRIQGVTYPETEVKIYIKDEKSSKVVEYGLMSDVAGNFLYSHRSQRPIRRGVANIFSSLSLSAVGGIDTYQFWVTAINGGVETQATRAFDIQVSKGSNNLAFSILVLGIAIILVMIALSLVLLRMKGAKLELSVRKRRK